MAALKIIIVVAALLFCPSLGAEYNCTRRYQRLLKEAAAVKAQCPNAALHDCCQIQNVSLARSSGQYEISDVCGVHLFGNNGKTEVLCDMETDKGGWIVIQCRVTNGTVNFTRGWKDYEEGFGDLDSEFWYSLRNIHCLTTRERVWNCE